MTIYKSPLQQSRSAYQPKRPSLMTAPFFDIKAQTKDVESLASQEVLDSIFKHCGHSPAILFGAEGNLSAPTRAEPFTIGIVLSGGQAPGGHNVIAGLYDALKSANPANTLIGFKGGAGGILACETIELDDDIIDNFRNSGGFNMIGSGRTKIETQEQFSTAKSVLSDLGIQGLVVVGGDDSNTNAALLAEYFAANNCKIKVVGVPKTIDGDLKNDHIPISFGFDTATKLYSELVGNIQRDAQSAKKYWHFIKLMGRSASHIALEVALKTQPNVTLISEEIADKKMSLNDVTNIIVESVLSRAKDGHYYGVVLIPEGVIEFIPELKRLIASLNDIMAKEFDKFDAIESASDKLTFVTAALNEELRTVYLTLPRSIQGQLIMDRDPHGNVQVSRIETEKLLVGIVEERLAELKKKGDFKGKFSTQCHFFGYEGRCAAPSNFDSDYCYALGFSAYTLLHFGYTGYIASVTNLGENAEAWKIGGYPLAAMIHLEKRHGEDKPVIRKALVDLAGQPFKTFADRRLQWSREDQFLSPGPIQYFGPETICDAISETLRLECREQH